MFAAVELLYQDGFIAKPKRASLVGQLFTGDYRGVGQLRLWPLEWVENAPDNHKPLAVLWHPVMVRVGYGDMLFRGYEAIRQAGQRRWVTQKWLCDVLDYQQAANARPDYRFGEVKPSR